nr:hypothetical protein CparaKRNrm3_p103 [Cryptomonas paramecium]
MFYLLFKKKVFKKQIKSSISINRLINDKYRVLYTKHKNKISIGIIFLSNFKRIYKRFFFTSIKKHPFKMFFFQKKNLSIISLHISLNTIVCFRKLIVLKQKFRNTMIS